MPAPRAQLLTHCMSQGQVTSPVAPLSPMDRASPTVKGSEEMGKGKQEGRMVLNEGGFEDTRHFSALVSLLWAGLSGHFMNIILA